MQHVVADVRLRRKWFHHGLSRYRVGRPRVEGWLHGSKSIGMESASVGPVNSAEIRLSTRWSDSTSDRRIFVGPARPHPTNRSTISDDSLFAGIATPCSLPSTGRRLKQSKHYSGRREYRKSDQSLSVRRPADIRAGG